MTGTLLLRQCMHQGGRMGDHPHLGALSRRSDQAGQWLQQLGMQAVLRFIEHQQRWEPRTEQRRRQQQITQHPIGEFARLQGPQQTWLSELQPEYRSRGIHAQLTPRESIVDRGAEAGPISNFLDRLHRGRQIAPIVG